MASATSSFLISPSCSASTRQPFLSTWKQGFDFPAAAIPVDQLRGLRQVVMTRLVSKRHSMGFARGSARFAGNQTAHLQVPP